jgi:hypothetical protein
MTAQKANNNIVEDMVESERDESPAADIRRMMIRMFNELKEELKENIQNSSMNIKRSQIKSTQKDTETT